MVVGDLSRGTVADLVQFEFDLGSGSAQGVFLRQRPAHRPPEGGVDAPEALRALRPHVHFHPRLEGDRVHRGPASDPAHVVARARPRARERVRHVLKVADPASQRVGRVREPERPPRMAARAPEDDAEPMGAEPLVHDPSESRPVDVDPGVDGVRPLAKQVFHPAQVAEPFLPDGPDELNVRLRLDAGGLERPQHREDRDEAARVVADAGGEERVSALLDRHVDELGEHRVQVPRQRHGSPLPLRRRPPRAAPAVPDPDRVALLVDEHGVGAGLAEPLRVDPGTFVLREGGRRNLREFDEFADRPRLEFLDDPEGALHGGMFGEAPDLVTRRLAGQSVSATREEGGAREE